MMKCFALLALLIVAAAAIDDHCAKFMTCDTCIAEPLCGWCSHPVVYPGNITGPQCAGFDPRVPTPFACNGIYSTEQCIQGYTCDFTDYTCKLDKPGSGDTKAQCQANCKNDGKVYLCNETTKECHEVEPGTPGAASKLECESSCKHPTPHPVTPDPNVTLWACNYSTGQCAQTEPGKGSSKEVCEQQCKKQNQTQYMCNKFLQKCLKLPPGIPGQNLEDCEKKCQNKPTPGPPPNMNKGLYRGIEIENGYTVGEVDLLINDSLVIYATFIDGKERDVSRGTPSHTESTNLEMWIEFTSGTLAGKTVKTISDNSGKPGAELVYMTTAMGAPGGEVPTSINDAMTHQGQKVLALGKCHTPECVFTLPESMYRVKARMVDHCSPFHESCEVCLAQKFCGWCSMNVTYKDGTVGTQCAGFNPDVNSSTAFVCAGRYSTLECTAGYMCSPDFKCVPTTPGNGMPKEMCTQVCRPTPPPTPPPQQYVCNITTKQCLKCNSTYCPGSLPLGPCEAACSNPKPGPSGNLIGIWRGIQIQNGYDHYEYQLVFTNLTVKMFKNKVYMYSANITSLGSDVMLMTVIDGPYATWSYGVIYQLATQPQGGYEEITYAQGVMGQSFPPSLQAAMSSAGMTEYKMSKCTEMPCKFEEPSK